MSQTQQFKITKDLIEAYVNNGYTVAQMAADVTTKTGVKCSKAVIQNACKTYGVNLLKKRKPTPFIFDDVTAPDSIGEPVLPTVGGLLELANAGNIVIYGTSSTGTTTLVPESTTVTNTINAPQATVQL